MPSKIDEINKLLKYTPFLKFELVYKRDVEFIKAVLEMPEWKEKRFQGLLAPSIWSSNYQDIRDILSIKNYIKKSINIYYLQVFLM